MQQKEDNQVDGSKEKIKLLKNAVLVLREEKKELESTILQQSGKISHLKNEKAEQVKEEIYASTITKLQSQIEQLIEKEQMHRMKIKSSIQLNNATDNFFSVFNNKGSILNSPRQKSPMGLSPRNSRNLNEELENVQNEKQQMELSLNTKISQLELDLEEHKKENNELKVGLASMGQKKENLEFEIRKLYQEIESQRMQIKKDRDELIDKQQSIEKLQKKMSQEELNHELLGHKYQQLQSELNMIECNLSQFKVKKLGLIQFDCLVGSNQQTMFKMLIRKNIQNNSVIELELPGNQDKVIYMIQDIVNIKRTSQEFELTFQVLNQSYMKRQKGQGKINERFHSEMEAKKICNILRYHLDWTSQTSTVSEKQESSQGFLRNFASLFKK